MYLLNKYTIYLKFSLHVLIEIGRIMYLYFKVNFVKSA